MDDDDDDDHDDDFFSIQCINSETPHPGRNPDGKTKTTTAWLKTCSNRTGNNREAAGIITPVTPDNGEGQCKSSTTLSTMQHLAERRHTSGRNGLTAKCAIAQNPERNLLITTYSKTTTGK